MFSITFIGLPKLDTMEITPGAKNRYHFIGKIYKKKNFYVKAKDDRRMDSLFEANSHHLLVFFKDYESPAYFVEDDFQEMTFKTIWQPELIKLGISVLIILNFFFWKHKYYQAILATGISIEEYMELHRRKTLREELREKENEKNKLDEK